jgi:hypothetical protein
MQKRLDISVDDKIAMQMRVRDSGYPANEIESMMKQSGTRNTFQQAESHMNERYQELPKTWLQVKCSHSVLNGWKDRRLQLGLRHSLIDLTFPCGELQNPHLCTKDAGL